MTQKIFISYAHKDESFKNDFIEHLSNLKRSNLISVWNDRDISAGNDWERVINENLESANIIVFLVSSSFIASDYCFSKEATRALELHNNGSAVIVPVFVRACDWKETPFCHIQGCPTDAKPINTYTDTDSAWLDVIQKIRSIISQRKAHTQELKASALSALPEKKNSQ